MSAKKLQEVIELLPDLTVEELDQVVEEIDRLITPSARKIRNQGDFKKVMRGHMRTIKRSR